jgi:hypothetical protein
VNKLESYPDEFMVSYQVRNNGYLFNLIWENNQLFLKQFSNASNDIQESISPTEVQWNDFYYFLNEIEVWKWYDEYVMDCNDSCVVGDEWEINIVWGDERIESKGFDSYPSTFREFLKAVEELTGFLIEFIQQD